MDEFHKQLGMRKRTRYGKAYEESSGGCVWVVLRVMQKLETVLKR